MPELILGDSLEALIDHRGKTPKKLGGDFLASGIPVASAMLIQNGRLRLGDARFVSEDIYRRWMQVPTRKNDVLLTSEAPIGRVAQVQNDEPLVLGQRLFGLRGKPGVLDSTFLYYALQSDAVQNELHGRSSGTTVAGIRQSELIKVRITTPDFTIQQAIAQILVALDDKIASNDRIGSTALELGDSWFTRMLQAPRAASSRLADLSAEGSLIFGDGYRTKRSEHGQPGLPILRVAEVLDGRIEPKLDDFVSEDYRSAMGTKISQPGDVILTTKGTVGRVAVITAKDPTFVYSPQVCYFRVPEKSVLSSSYVHFWLRSADFRRQAAPMKSQTDMADYLSLTDIRNLAIPIPIPEGRWQISMLSSLLARISVCHEESRVLAELRDTLLPKLLSGEIRVREAEKVVEGVV